MVFGILLGTGLFYLVFADGRVQPWNNPSESSRNNINNSLVEIELSHEAKENFIKNF
jgi:hypothetical protein